MKNDEVAINFVVIELEVAVNYERYRPEIIAELVDERVIPRG